MNGKKGIGFYPYSSDANLIENMWNYLKRDVEKKKAKNLDQLEENVKEEWQTFHSSFFFLSLKACQRAAKV